MTTRKALSVTFALVFAVPFLMGAKYKDGKVCCLTQGETYTAPIKGMVCSGCVKNVTDALLKLKGIEAASVDYDKGLLTVRAKGTVKIKAIEKALRSASVKMGMGAKYEIGELTPVASTAADSSPAASVADLKTVTCRVKGMTCAGCAAMIEGALSKTKGVKTARVSLKEERAVVQFDPAQAVAKDVVSAIEKAGYKAEVIE